MHGSLFLEAQGFEPRIPIRSPEIYLLPVASICLQCVFVDLENSFCCVWLAY